MRGDIRLNDLLNLVANEVGGHSNPNIARKYLEALERVILKELKLNKRINLYEFGTFEVFRIGGYDKKMGDLSSGYGTIIKYIQPKDKLKFTPSKKIEKIINEYDYEVPDKKPKKKKEKKTKTVDYKERNKKRQPTMEESIVNLLNKD